MTTEPIVRYSTGARWLHWLVALAIVAAFGLGLVSDALGFSPLKLRLVNWHKWLGVTVFGLAVLRLAWRLFHRPPLPLPGPVWQTGIARAVHGLLYVLIFAMPVSGYFFSLASGYPVVWLGRFPLPVLIAPDDDLADQLFELHETMAWLLAALVVVHVLAALKHHLIDHDDTMRRMLPARSVQRRRT